MSRRTVRRSTAATGLLAAAALGAAALPLLGSAAQAAPAAPAPAGVLATPLAARLTQAAGGSGRLATSPATGHLSFFGADPGRAVAPPRSLAGPASPAAAAGAFLSSYGSLFGVADPAHDLRLTAQTPSAAGGTTLRYQQLDHGLPVVGGQLVVDVDAAGATRSANGEASDGLATAPTPRLTAAQAAANAVAAVAKWQHRAGGTLSASAPVLSVYDPALLGARGPQLRQPVYELEVSSASADVRELVLVHAGTGSVVLHFSRNADAKTRYVCNFKNVVKSSDACTSGYARTEGSAATGIKDVDLAYDYAGVTYDFYKTLFNRDSVDGKGLALRSTVKYCPDSSSCPFANAYWNGKQMVYGDSYASADDVVGHELTHAVTEFTSGLFYYMQSGALNESLSDVFGEIIDLTDGKGTDTAAVKYQIGEDLPIGAIRDMMHPESFGDPDRMTSFNYYSGTQDAGGVHTNSGVDNKAAALLIGGGSFNGQTVTALGPTKTARVYYGLENLMTSGSDYGDVFNLLPQACTNQVGTNGITAADCTQVKKAVTATEMNKQNDYAPAPEAPVCPTGTAKTNLFFDDLENPASGNWKKAKKSTSAAYFGWAYPQDTNGYPAGAVDVDYAHSGKTVMWGDDLGDASDDPNGVAKAGSSTMTLTKNVVVPAGKKAYFRFAHAFGFESDFFDDYDGGKVDYSADGGTTWKDLGSLPSVNGYNSTAVEALGGKPGFSGLSNGYMSSRWDLSSLAGKSVKVRFTVANDEFVGDYGWFVDDVNLYTCG